MKLGSLDEWKRWAHEGRIGWAACVLLIGGAVWLYAASPTQDCVRLTGLVYEVIGIVVVLVEVAKASDRNNLAPLHRRMVAYLCRLPLLPQKSNTVIVAGTARASFRGLRARLSGGLSPDATLDQRVNLLEQRVTALDDRIEMLEKRIEAEQKARREEIAAERSARESAIAALDGRIKDVEVGGLDLSLFGVFFLLVGVVLTNATPEVCWLLGCR